MEKATWKFQEGKIWRAKYHTTPINNLPPPPNHCLSGLCQSLPFFKPTFEEVVGISEYETEVQRTISIMEYQAWKNSLRTIFQLQTWARGQRVWILRYIQMHTTTVGQSPKGKVLQSHLWTLWATKDPSPRHNRQNTQPARPILWGTQIQQHQRQPLQPTSLPMKTLSETSKTSHPRNPSCTANSPNLHQRSSMLTLHTSRSQGLHSVPIL